MNICPPPLPGYACEWPSRLAGFRAVVPGGSDPAGRGQRAKQEGVSESKEQAPGWKADSRTLKLIKCLIYQLETHVITTLETFASCVGSLVEWLRAQERDSFHKAESKYCPLPSWVFSDCISLAPNLHWSITFNFLLRYLLKCIDNMKPL